MITVLHLYPRELGINGDVGNVMALQKRAEWRGVELRVLDHEIGAELPDEVHLVHIGSGPASGQELVVEDLARIAPRLREWAESGVPFLAIAAGWQLLGSELTLPSGVVAGAGIFPTRSTTAPSRIVREVWTKDAAGFENHGALTTTESGVPAGWPVARFGTSIATNLHGPFLPMNPSFADELLAVAASRAGVELGEADVRLAEVDDRAARSRAAVRSRV